MLVQDVMTPDPFTVTVATSAREAMTALARHHISTLPVVAEQVVVGIVSEVDLIRDGILPDPRAHLMLPRDVEPEPARTVADVMTSPAVVVHGATDVENAVGVMASRGFKSLPVVGPDGRLVGMVSRSDVVTALSRGDDAIREEVSLVVVELGRRDWSVEVDHGVVVVTGPVSARECSLARASAAAVPGVVRVTTRRR